MSLFFYNIKKKLNAEKKENTTPDVLVVEKQSFSVSPKTVIEIIVDIFLVAIFTYFIHHLRNQQTSDQNRENESNTGAFWSLQAIFTFLQTICAFSFLLAMLKQQKEDIPVPLSYFSTFLVILVCFTTLAGSPIISLSYVTFWTVLGAWCLIWTMGTFILVNRKCDIKIDDNI